jgi:UDP-N-acetylglucosamine:LPS N-acetylglucosamine transferase
MDEGKKDGRKKDGRKKVMAVASGGGHWVQMRRILPAFAGCETVHVSVGPVPASEGLEAPARAYRVHDVTRRNPLGLIRLVWQLARILRAERPDVVVTTGAAPGLMGIAVAKLITRSRTIWIDSVANTERLSLSGRMARPVADAWLVQWEHLARPGGPAFWGAVL